MSKASSAARTRRNEMLRSRTASLIREAHQLRDKQARAYHNYQRAAGNMGVYHGAVDPAQAFTLSGQPRVFDVYHEVVAAQLRAGTTFKGRPPVPFTVKRDEAVLLPFGGFRVYWRELEVGRTLSWPTYDDCKRLRERRRRDADPRERKLLDSVH